MKKFLSLVLALIMTMSLVTISAGATEYRDLTDKDEIQYEEAVAVLNRIGVITGYEDGSFRPETELTRGAAAKIIVSLMIGPDAASALPNNASPYPDVPAGHTFAGVIGYCKTAGYISGYGDGTFKPANPLTGYAFAKMLLGAIGYKANIEGFVDTGWTMNVARIGNVAGLFDRLNFDGAKAVTRDEACQLALNTLKATMVDYGNSNTVVSSNGQVLTVQGSKAQYVTSNNRDINANINRRVISAQNNEMTLEFGEEHFKDLRLEHDRYDPAYDIYGHPSNEWSYKKVTIGTFPLPADFTFTKQMAHLEDTQATKEKALGLRGYDTYSTDHKGGYVNWSTASSDLYAGSPFADATQIHINGWEARVRNSDYKQTDVPANEKNVGQGNWYSYDAYDIGSANKELAPSLSEICDLTDNGVTVEVYVCPVDADFITDVVVIRTQLMEVDRIASDYVELDTIDSDSKDPRKEPSLAKIAGYNDYSLFDEVVSVKDNNYDAYNVLKELKAGDEVAVIPYTSDNGKTWEVGRAYVPETVSGVLTNVDIYNTKSKPDGNAVAITVGGTTYPIAQWNKDMIDIDGYKIKASKKDVTLLLDEMGNALLAKDVAASDNWIIVGDYYQATLSSGRVGWFVHGWTIKGDEVDLELGTIRGAAEKYAPGELVRYRVAEVGNGEYELSKPNYNKEAVWKNGAKATWSEPRLQNGGKDTGEGVYTISQYAYQTGAGVNNQYKIQSRNTLLPLDFYNTAKDAATPYSVIEGDRLDYSKATSQYDVVANGDKLGGATTYYTEKDNLGNTVATGTGTSSFDHWFYKTAPYDGVKFIYVGFDTANGEVETINFLDGVQNVEHKELLHINRWWKNVGTNDLTQFVASPAEAYVDKNGKVKAVVIKSDSAEANLKDLMIITDNRGANTSVKSTGAEAPTSGTYYTRQYVSGEDGFKEEKTGYFDKALSVGTVVTGRLGTDNIFKSRIFHATEYTNRNPDGIYVKGIGPLKTLEGKTSDNAFYVGPLAVDENGIALKKPEVRKLGTGVQGDVTMVEADNVCDILSGKDVLGVNDNTPKKGLIKVDSTTQFIDLRDGRPGDIDEIGDLFDLKNNANIELKLILNGNSSSDGFRHAYAIMILEAESAADNATVPAVNITAGIGGVGITGDNLTVDTTKTPVEWTVKAAPGSSVNLNAVPKLALTNYGTLTYNWANNYGISSTSSNITVTAPAAGEKVELTLTVTNRDVDKADKITETYTVKVFVVGAGSTPGVSGTKHTLTLIGSLLVNSSSAKVTVFEGDTSVNAAYSTKLINGATTEVAQYQVSEGAKVTVMETGSDTLTTADKTATVGTTEINLKTNGSGKDTLEFTMPKSDLTVNMTAKSTLANGDTAATETFSVTLHRGITGTYKESSTATEIKALNAATVTGTTETPGVTKVPDGAVITITGLDGAVAIGSSTPVVAPGTPGTDNWAKDATITISGNSIELWAATRVVLDGHTKVGTLLAASDDKFVPIGTVLKPEADSGSDTQTGYITGSGKTATQAVPAAGITVTGADQININAAFKLTLGTGTKATIDGSDVTGTVWVVSGETVTPAATSAAQVAVLKTSADQWFGDEAAAGAINADQEYMALTKVTIKADTGAKVIDRVYYLSQGTGNQVLIKAGDTTDKVVGVKSGEDIAVEASLAATADGKTYKVDVTGATRTYDAVNGSQNSTHATIAATVGNDAITITRAEVV